MADFNFRLWLEAVPELKVHNPGGAADMWMHNLPHDSPQNDTEIWKFSEAMASPRQNAELMAHLMIGIDFHPIMRYGPKKISGNLLNLNSPLLREATGEIVSHPKQMLFGFGVEEPIKGKLIIAAPPVAYTPEDRALLAGIIRHELRHAADFVHMGGNGKGMATGELATTDLDGYVNHIMEARAFSDQLRWVLKLMGNNVPLVMDALKKSAFFGMGDTFAKVAQYFLEALVKHKNEAVVPIVSKAENPDMQVNAKKAAYLVMKILKIMQFSNLVHVSPKVKR